MADAGYRLSVEGEREFKAALAAIDQQIKVNKAELKLLTAEYNANGGELKNLTSRQAVLQDTYKQQASKVETLDEKYKALADTYGDTDKRTAAVKVQLLAAAEAMAKTEGEIRKNEEALEDFSSAAKAADDEMDNLEAALKANDAEIKLWAKSAGSSAEGMEALTKKTNLLAESVETQRKKVQLLNRALDEAAGAYGTGSTKANKYREQLANAEMQLVELEKQQKKTNETLENGGKSAAPLSDALDVIKNKIGIELPEGLENLVGKFDGFAAKAGGTIAAIGSGVKIAEGVIGEIVEAGGRFSELRESAELIGLDTTNYQMLEYALESAGIKTENLSEVLNPLYTKIKETHAVVGEYSNGTTKLGEASGELADKIASQEQKVNTLGETLLKTEERYGEASEAAEKYRAQLEKEQDALKDLRGEISERDTAAKEAMKVWEELGVQLYDDNGKLRDIKEILFEVVDAYDDMENGTERITEMQKIFGESAGKVNKIVEVGAENLRNYAEAAEESGAIISQEMVRAMDDVDTAVNNFKLSWQNVKDSFFAGILFLLRGDTESAAESGKSLWANIKRMFTGHYATGTYNHPGGWAVVGEQGPEIAYMPAGSKVWPSGRYPDGWKTSGGDTYNITIDAASVREFNDIVRLAKSAKQNERMGVAE